MLSQWLLPRRRLESDPLMIRIRLPGGEIHTRKIGGETISQNTLKVISAKFLGPKKMWMEEILNQSVKQIKVR